MPYAFTGLAALVAAAAASTAALAAPNCSSEPRGKWMAEEAMKAKVVDMGYKDIRTFKTSGSCYELYGFTKDGQKAEVYFNPVTGEVVQSKIGG